MKPVFSILVCLTVLSACAELPPVGATDTAEATTATTDAAVETRKPTFLESLGLATKPAPTATAEATNQTPPKAKPAPSPTATAATPEPATKPRGLAALFQRPKPQAKAPDADVAATRVAAATAPSAGPVDEPEETAKPRRGLFSALAAPKANQTSPDVTLPFGQVGVSCNVPRAKLGKQVDKFPREGRAVWKLYDTAPSSTAPRTQFINGFNDGCARQFTAALTLFGSAALHEAHRYSSAMRKRPYSAADNAYESIKLTACGVARGKPCPASKIGKLEKDLAFVSIYRRFGDTKSRLELLLHRGRLITTELR